MIKRLKTITLLTILSILFVVSNTVFSFQESKRFIVYAGGFGGVTMPTYQMDGLFVDFNGAVEGQNIHLTTSPVSAEGGADVGFAVHFLRRGILGLEYNFTDFGTPNSQTTIHIDGQVTDGNYFDIIQRLQLNYANDALFTLGIAMGDNNNVHLLVKAGVSFMNLLSQLTSTVIRGIPNTLRFGEVETTFTGPVVGLNLTYDLSRHINLFAEYLYRTYAHEAITQELFNIDPLNSNPNQLTNRTVTVSANSIHVGLNLYTSF